MIIVNWIERLSVARLEIFGDKWLRSSRSANLVNSYAICAGCRVLAAKETGKKRVTIAFASETREAAAASVSPPVVEQA